MELQGLSPVPADPINSAAIAASCKTSAQHFAAPCEDEPGAKKGDTTSGGWLWWRRGHGGGSPDDSAKADSSTAAGGSSAGGGSGKASALSLLLGGASLKRPRTPSPKLYETDAPAEAGEEYERVPAGKKPSASLSSATGGGGGEGDGSSQPSDDAGRSARMFSRFAAGGGGAPAAQLAAGLLDEAAAEAAAGAEEGRGTPPRPGAGDPRGAAVATPRNCSPFALIHPKRNGAGGSSKVFPM